MSSARKNHVVLLPRPDGSVEMHAMKQWLRQNPEHIPSGCDATLSTSQQLGAGLRKLGWTMQETDREFRMIPPGAHLPKGSVLDESLELEIDENEESSDDTYFGLEYQLRDFLAQNIAAVSIAGRRLQIYVDPTGRDGIEYPTAVGPIDILAVDQGGAFFVLELKRGRTPDYTIGQLMRYMGWVQQTIGKSKDVHGVVVAKVISDALRYAVCVVPKVSLFEYEVSFRLRPASDLAAQ